MKTERRHELEANVVSTWINDQVERARPYRTLLFAGAVAIGAALLVIVIVRNRGQAQQEESWQSYLSASLGAAVEVKDLVSVADEYPGTTAGRWALLRGADEARSRGADALFDDRDEAEENLDKALKLYERALEDAKAEPLFLEWASYGRAQTLECLMKLEDAREAYREILEKWPNGQYVKSAEEHLKLLEDPTAESFAKWFRVRAKTMRKRSPFDDSIGLDGASSVDPFSDTDGFGSGGSIFEDPFGKHGSKPADGASDDKGKAGGAVNSLEADDKSESPDDSTTGDGAKVDAPGSPPADATKAEAPPEKANATDPTSTEKAEANKEVPGDSPAP